MCNIPDAEVVRQVLDGNTGAYGMLITRYYRRVLAYCKARVWCQATAEDLTQDAFISGLEYLGSLREYGKFRPWLDSITRRLCERWRSGYHNRASPLPPWGPGGDCPGFGKVERDDWLQCQLGDLVLNEPLLGKVEDRLEKVDLKGGLLEVVEGLPPRQRVVVVLHYLGDLTYAETAEVLGCSEATVGNLLREARECLRQRLGPDFAS